MATLLSAASSLLVGLILVIVPWTGLWDSNYLLSPYPALRGVLLSAFTRGSVTGLGLINILIAIQETRQHLTESRDGT